MGAEGWGHGKEGVGYQLYLVKADRSGKTKKIKTSFHFQIAGQFIFLEIPLGPIEFPTKQGKILECVPNMEQTDAMYFLQANTKCDYAFNNSVMIDNKYNKVK